MKAPAAPRVPRGLPRTKYLAPFTQGVALLLVATGVLAQEGSISPTPDPSKPYLDRTPPPLLVPETPAPAPTPTPSSIDESEMETGFRPPEATEADRVAEERWATVPVLAVRSEPKLLTNWELRRLVDFELGKVVSSTQAQRSVEILLATDRFASVKMRREPVPGGDEMVFMLEPQPFVSNIKVKGNHLVSKRKVRAWLPFRYYDRLDAAVMTRIEEVLGDRYVQAGFGRPKVAVTVERLHSNGATRIRIQLSEVPMPRLVDDLNLEDRPSSLQLHERIWLWWTNHRDHLFKPPRANQVHLEDHSKRSLQYLRGIGYVDAQAKIELSDGPSPHANLRFDTGKRVRFRVVGGSTNLRDNLRRSFWKDSYRVSERELERLRRKAEEYLTRKGFLQAKLRTELTETDKDRRLTLFIDGGSFTTVRQIQFEGNRSVSASELEAAMLTHTKSWWPWSKARFSPLVLEEDVKAVKGVFALHGFPKARVEETHQLEPDGTVRIRIRIEEGIHQRVGRIQFTGQTDMTGEQLLAIADRAGLRTGADLSRSLLGQAAQAITLRYNSRGFPDVQLHVQRGDVRGEDVDLSIDIQEGVRQHAGKLIASGNYKTTTKTMISGFPWQEGDPVSSSRLARLRERQVDIGVMDSVLLEKKPDPDGKTDLIVHVQERRSGSFGVTALLDNVAGVGAEVQITHENLFHRGLEGNLEGGIQTLGVSSDDVQRARVLASLRKAILFGEVLPTTFSLLYFHDKTFEDFEETQREASLTVARAYMRKKLQLSILTSLTDTIIEAKPGHVLVDAPDDGKVFSISPRAVYEGRNDVGNPTRGYFASFRLQVSPSIFGGETDFVRIDGDVRHYLRVGEASSVALALRGGIAASYATGGEIPTSDRYFLGGDSTHRSFPFRELAPRDAVGNIIGGTSFVLANAEFRFPLLTPLYGGIFVDVGNAFDENVSFALRPGLGVGLRYYTIIGPLRFDVGWNPDRKTFPDPTSTDLLRTKTESAFAIHLALGHSF